MGMGCESIGMGCEGIVMSLKVWKQVKNVWECVLNISILVIISFPAISLKGLQNGPVQGKLQRGLSLHFPINFI